MTKMESIMRSRLSGERDGTYAMLMQLVAAKQTPECLRALEHMVVKPIGCWRDVRGFIRHYEQHGDPGDAESAMAIMEGCVRMTNAQLRKDRAAGRPSWAAKWVPREPKCRASPLLRWYYDALAADMFPGVPDANRRFRKLVSALSPTSTDTRNSNRTIPGLVHMVRQAERARTSAETETVNALWQKHLVRCNPTPTQHQAIIVPALSLAHSMGPGHSNCLHAGIGLALHFLHLSPWPSRLLTFSSHAEWHDLSPDFVSQVQQLLGLSRSPINGLNANAMALKAATATVINAMAPDGVILLIISDMEHDDPSSPAQGVMTWNASRNGRPASFHGDKPRILHNPT